MSRGARIAVGALGAALVLAAVTGRGELFVRPWFVPVLLVAGAALLLVAWRGRGHVPHGAAALLLVPVLVGAALPPSVAGRITTFTGTGSAVQARLGDGSNPLLAGRGGKVTILQIASAQQQAGAVYLDGRRISVEGVVDSGNRLTRLVMVCCAADAQPVSIPVRGSLPSPGSWVSVTGTLSARGGRLSLLAQRVVAIPTPQDPFL